MGHGLFYKKGKEHLNTDNAFLDPKSRLCI